MYLFSSEIRWFFKGRTPVDVHDWFCRNHEYIQSAPREDRYLKLPGCHTVGVKLREGRFEIKVLRDAPQPLKLTDDVSGLNDSWIKWSSRDLGIDRLIRRTDAWESHEWLTVRKERWLRWYGVADVRPVANPGTSVDGSGCGFELTGLRIGEENWWTLGFEAVGHPNDIPQLLQTTCADVFSGNPCPQKIHRQCSFAYPQWLSTIIGNSDVH